MTAAYRTLRLPNKEQLYCHFPALVSEICISLKTTHKRKYNHVHYICFILSGYSCLGKATPKQPQVLFSKFHCNFGDFEIQQGTVLRIPHSFHIRPQQHIYSEETPKWSMASKEIESKEVLKP